MKPKTLQEKTLQWIYTNIEYNEKEGVFYYKSTSTKYPTSTTKKGYVKLSVGDIGSREYVYAHRVAWFFLFGYFPIHQVDHIDLDKGNNSCDNLRKAEPFQNNGNVAPRKGCYSKYKGVTKRYSANFPWRARGFITNNGVKRSVYLGSFLTEEEAAKAYNEWAQFHFQEYARINEVA